MANAAVTVRNTFIDSNEPLTLAKIRIATGLKASEISMALNYLMKYKWLTREFVENKDATNRFKVWEYTFHPERNV